MNAVAVHIIDYAISNSNKHKLPRNKCNKTYRIFIRKTLKPSPGMSIKEGRSRCVPIGDSM